MHNTIIKPVLLCGGLLTSSIVSAQEIVQTTDKDFTMDGELGLIVTTGNTDTSSVKGRLSSHHEMPNWSNDYVFEAFYKRDEVDLEDGSKESQTAAQKFFLSGQGNYKLANPDNRMFVFASYEDDRFSSFDYQATIAGGWNSQLWNEEKSAFSYSIGPGYAFADTIDGEDAGGLIVRAAVDYQWMISESANFKQIISTEIGEDNTKSKSETSLSAKINGALSMKVSLILNHNSEVIDDTKNLDTETAVTLVYTFF